MSMLSEGDLYEVLEDSNIQVFSSTELPSVENRTYIDLKVGDLVRYIGPRRSGRGGMLLYKFILSPVDSSDELTGEKYPFYVVRIAKLFEQMGYEVT